MKLANFVCTFKYNIHLLHHTLEFRTPTSWARSNSWPCSTACWGNTPWSWSSRSTPHTCSSPACCGPHRTSHSRHLCSDGTWRWTPRAWRSSCRTPGSSCICGDDRTGRAKGRREGTGRAKGRRKGWWLWGGELTGRRAASYWHWHLIFVICCESC